VSDRRCQNCACWGSIDTPFGWWDRWRRGLPADSHYARPMCYRFGANGVPTEWAREHGRCGPEGYYFEERVPAPMETKR